MKMGIKENLKNNIIIGAYFIAAGSSRIKSSVYETAVLFVYSIFKHHPKDMKEIKTLPSHLFKNLPVVVGSSIYDYILCNSLFSLKYIYEAKTVYTRFVFNRIMTLKMINEILKMIKT